MEETEAKSRIQNNEESDQIVQESEQHSQNHGQNLQQPNENLHEKIQYSELTVKQLEDAKKNLQQDNQSLEQRNQDLLRENEKLEKARQRLEQTIQDKQRENENLEQVKLHLEQANQSLHQTFQGLDNGTKQERDKRKEEITNLKVKLAEVTTDLKCTEKQMNHYEKELGKTKTECETYRCEKERLNIELSQYKAMLECLKEDRLHVLEKQKSTENLEVGKHITLFTDSYHLRWNLIW